MTRYRQLSEEDITEGKIFHAEIHATARKYDIKLNTLLGIMGLHVSVPSRCAKGIYPPPKDWRERIKVAVDLLEEAQSKAVNYDRACIIWQAREIVENEFVFLVSIGKVLSVVTPAMSQYPIILNEYKKLEQEKNHGNQTNNNTQA